MNSAFVWCEDLCKSQRMISTSAFDQPQWMTPSLICTILHILLSLIQLWFAVLTTEVLIPFDTLFFSNHQTSVIHFIKKVHIHSYKFISKDINSWMRVEETTHFTKLKNFFWYPPLKVKRKLLIWINGLKHSCN